MRMVLLVWGICAASALAQEFVAPAGPSPDELPILPAPTESRPSVEGIVKQIFTVDKPWQMINPAAPASYGNGREDVTYSQDDEGKPKGFILFALEW